MKTDNFRAEIDQTENKVTISTGGGEPILDVYGRGPELANRVVRAVNALREELSELEGQVTEALDFNE